MSDLESSDNDTMSNDHSSMNDTTSSSNDTTSSSEGSDSEMYANDHHEEFPRDLPIRHQYLGNTEEIRGRVVLSDGEFINIPILKDCDGVRVALVPDQVVPLTFHYRAELELVQTALSQNNIIGLLHQPLEDQDNEESRVPHAKGFGTTAEICEMSERGQGKISLIVKGRQRFKMREGLRHSHGFAEAMVEILPEVQCSDPLGDFRFPYTQRLNSSFDLNLPTTAEELRRMKKTKRMRKRSAMQTQWPSWVYDMYDPALLSCKLVSSITTAFHQKPNQLNIPKTPREISYWCVKNLPVSHKTRLRVLSMNSPIQRLRNLVRVTNKVLQTTYVQCNMCNSNVVNMKNIFSMTDEGPQGTFVNPGGFVHEMITAREVQRIIFYGIPTREHSWFPGYSWQIMNCSVCARHLGWKFRAVDAKLKPKKFYGIVHSALAPQAFDGFYDVDLVV